jgi:hypothetical protein
LELSGQTGSYPINPFSEEVVMVTLPVSRAMRIYATLTHRDGPSGTRERLARHLLKKYVQGERDRNRLTVEGLSYLRALDNQRAASR